MKNHNSPGAGEHVCQWKPERLHLANGNEILYTFRDFRYQMEERCAEEDASAEAEQETHDSRGSIDTVFFFYHFHTYLANSIVFLYRGEKRILKNDIGKVLLCVTWDYVVVISQVYIETNIYALNRLPNLLAISPFYLPHMSK